jgi:hypothetical protein
MIPNKRFLDNLTFWQIESLRAFDSGLIDFMILEWARRHWKTTTILNILLRCCCEYPNSIYTHVFPFYREARETVWEDPNMLDSFLPDKKELGWNKNEAKLHVKFENGSIYRLVGADNFETMRGPDCHGVGFDEWSLIKEQAWTTIFMPVIAGKQHGPNVRRNRFALFGYTPKGVNHATRMFDWAACLDEPGQTLPESGKAGKCRDKWFASRVINDRTNFLNREFLDMAEALWPRAVRDQETNCARITEEERVLITSAMIEELKNYRIIYPKTRHIVSCDPSLGGDACPIQYIKNYRIEDELILHERNPMIITGHIIAMGIKHECEDFIVDATGITIGKAIAARMREQGHTKVYEFESAGKANDEKRFVNQKAEAWFEGAKLIQEHKVPYIESEVVRQDISSVRYKTTDSRGRLALELKEETKKRLGRSPDYGDTFIQGIWRLQNVIPIEEKRKKDRWDKQEKTDSYMAM